jgi:hypothetical protein
VVGVRPRLVQQRPHPRALALAQVVASARRARPRRSSPRPARAPTGRARAARRAPGASAPRTPRDRRLRGRARLPLDLGPNRIRPASRPPRRGAGQHPLECDAFEQVARAELGVTLELNLSPVVGRPHARAADRHPPPPSVTSPGVCPRRLACRRASWRPRGPTTWSTSCSMHSCSTASPAAEASASSPSFATLAISPSRKWTSSGSGTGASADVPTSTACGFLFTAVPSVSEGLDRPERSQPERTRREDRRLNFYIEGDNLPSVG